MWHDTESLGTIIHETPGLRHVCQKGTTADGQQVLLMCVKNICNSTGERKLALLKGTTSLWGGHDGRLPKASNWLWYVPKLLSGIWLEAFVVTISDKIFSGNQLREFEARVQCFRDPVSLIREWGGWLLCIVYTYKINAPSHVTAPGTEVHNNPISIV
jgi:hypothetical protein